MPNAFFAVNMQRIFNKKKEEFNDEICTTIQLLTYVMHFDCQIDRARNAQHCHVC